MSHRGGGDAIISEEAYVHDREHSAFLLRRLHDSIPHLVSLVPDALVALLDIALAQEPLQEGSIYPMQRHPVEVPLHRLRVARGEQKRLLAIRIPEPWCRKELGGRVLGSIRPEIGIRSPAIGYGVVEPGKPAVMTRTDWLAISGAGEPALIADKELIVDSGRVGALERPAFG